MYSVQVTAQCGGFPHSEICGSKSARNSPRLIAACYVLHRLSVPRHPPNALRRLIRETVMRRDKPNALNFTTEHDRRFTTTTILDSTHKDHRWNRRTLFTMTNSHGAEAPTSGFLRTNTAHTSFRVRIQPSSSIDVSDRRMVEVNGIEPMTSCLQSRRSPN